MSSPTDYLKLSIRTALQNNNNENPVPKTDFPCSICRYEVKHNHKAIQCTSCELWVHIKCNGISVDEYTQRQNNNLENPNLVDNELWSCMLCILNERSAFFHLLLLVILN